MKVVKTYYLLERSKIYQKDNVYCAESRSSSSMRLHGADLMLEHMSLRQQRFKVFLDIIFVKWVIILQDADPTNVLEVYKTDQCLPL